MLNTGGQQSSIAPTLAPTRNNLGRRLLSVHRKLWSLLSTAIGRLFFEETLAVLFSVPVNFHVDESYEVAQSQQMINLTATLTRQNTSEVFWKEWNQLAVINGWVVMQKTHFGLNDFKGDFSAWTWSDWSRTHVVLIVLLAIGFSLCILGAVFYVCRHKYKPPPNKARAQNISAPENVKIPIGSIDNQEGKHQGTHQGKPCTCKSCTSPKGKRTPKDSPVDKPISPSIIREIDGGYPIQRERINSGRSNSSKQRGRDDGSAQYEELSQDDDLLEDASIMPAPHDDSDDSLDDYSLDSPRDSLDFTRR